jgi:hypothetical protein
MITVLLDKSGFFKFNFLMFGALAMTHLLLPSAMDKPGNTKGGSITVPLTSCLSGLD